MATERQIQLKIDLLATLDSKDDWRVRQDLTKEIRKDIHELENEHGFTVNISVEGDEITASEFIKKPIIPQTANLKPDPALKRD
jgi:hypothetical protein